MESVRLQKYLADCGVASRRKCEEIILQQRVTVDGAAVSELGVKVSGGERICVDGKPVKAATKKRYILLNKPSGYVTTVSDEYGRKTVLDLIKSEIKERIYPVGRLDFESEGLLMLTNDGEAAYAMTHPKHDFDKTYIVALNKVPSPANVDKLRRGVVIDDKKTLPAKVEWMKDNVLKIIITEGRNRQIRKMAEAVGYEVVSLRRIAIGNIQLGHIPSGRWRHMTPGEIRYVKGAADDDHRS